MINIDDFKKELAGSLGLVDTSNPYTSIKGLLDGSLRVEKPAVKPASVFSVDSPQIQKPSFSTANSTEQTTPDLAGRGPLSALQDLLVTGANKVATGIKNIKPIAPVAGTFDFNKTNESITKAPKTVRPQDFKDVVNILPILGGYFAKPVVDATFSIKDAITGGNSSLTIPTPFSDEEHGKFALQSETSQQFYNKQIDAGVDPKNAFFATALKTVGDISVLVPIARDLGKFSLLRTAPDALINRDMVSATRNELRDFVSGADTFATGKSPLPPIIQDAFKSLSNEEKSLVVKQSGIDVLQTTPTKLGKLFGVSQAEADALYQTGVRQGSSGGLPGYRTEPGQAPAFGLSTERVEPVGFGEEKPHDFPIEKFTQSGIKNILEDNAVKLSDTITDGEGMTYKITSIKNDPVSGNTIVDVTPQDIDNPVTKTFTIAEKISPTSKEPATILKMGDKNIELKKNGEIDIPEMDEATTQDLFSEFSKDEAAKSQEVANKTSQTLETKQMIDFKKSLGLKDTDVDPANIEALRLEKENLEQTMGDNEAKNLAKFTSKVTGELPEVTGKETVSSPTTGKQIKNSLFGKRGDDVVTALGFKDLDAAQKAFDTYLAQRTRLNEIRTEISKKVKDYRDKKQIIEAVEAKLRGEGRERSKQVSLIQDFFELSDSEFKAITKNTPDFRLMSDERFKGYLKEIYNKAHDAFKLAEARMEVKATILDKELLKVDNLQQAKKLPTIENMTIGQLTKFNELMETFKQGDEFLGVRQLQTINNTDLSGIHTRREVLEDLAKRTGLNVNDLNDIKVGSLDHYLYDTALARRNPLFQILVEDSNKAIINANLRYTEFHHTMNDLLKKARASRARSLIDRLIPTDETIVDYLEAPVEEKLKIIKSMTDEELKAANYIQQNYAAARDYLVQRDQLKTRYWDNYYTHLPVGFLEQWKNGIKDFSVRKSLSEFIKTFKEQEKVVNILDQKTNQILPLEKFMAFTLKREGDVASKDIGRAVSAYFKVFENKAALDSIIPKLDVYVHVLSPKKLTPRGLEFDDSLRTFFKEWMNSKKGRLTPRAMVKQGSVEMGLIKSGIAFTRLLDLGFSIPVGLASHVGEQIGTFVVLGTKDYATGLARYSTKDGRAIAKKYAGFVGETLLQKLGDTSINIKDKLGAAIFSLFSSADRKANVVSLLGSMTPEEFANKEISVERLAKIKAKMGKYRVTHGDASIWQKTAGGQIAYQYKKWAEPILLSTVHNVRTLGSMLLNGEEGAFKTDEFQELLRSTLATAFAALFSYSTYHYLSQKKHRTFLENVAYKAVGDSYSMISALNPANYTKYRLIGFLDDLATSLTTISASLVTGARTAKNAIPGLSQLKTTLEPKAVKQFTDAFSSAPVKKSSANSNIIPSLNSLAGLKKKLSVKPAALNSLKNLKTSLKLK